MRTIDKCTLIIDAASVVFRIFQIQNKKNYWYGAYTHLRYWTIASYDFIVEMEYASEPILK